MIASDASTDPERLRELGLSRDSSIHKAVVENPNTPADVLLQLEAELYSCKSSKGCN